jgi:hypothetical protein
VGNLKMTFLIFTSEQKANAALTYITTAKKYPFLPKDKNTGETRYDKQATTGWAEVLKAYGQDLFYFAKPDPEFISAVHPSDYVESQYDYNWEEPWVD